MIDMRTEVGIRLAQLRELNGKTQEQVAEEIGARTPGRQWVEKYADYYNVDVEVILGRRPIPDSLKKIHPSRRAPILGTAACGEPMLAEQNIEGYVDLPGDMAPGAELALIRIKGDSMEGARLYDGQLAIVRLQDDADNSGRAVRPENLRRRHSKRVRES